MHAETARYRISSDVRFRRVGDEGIVLRQRDGEVLVLNEVAMRTLELLATGHNLVQLCHSLADEYDVQHSIVQADTAELLRDLVDCGVLVRPDEDTAAP